MGQLDTTGNDALFNAFVDACIVQPVIDAVMPAITQTVTATAINATLALRERFAAAMITRINEQVGARLEAAIMAEMQSRIAALQAVTGAPPPPAQAQPEAPAQPALFDVPAPDAPPVREFKIFQRRGKWTVLEQHAGKRPTFLPEIAGTSANEVVKQLQARFPGQKLGVSVKGTDAPPPVPAPKAPEPVAAPPAPTIAAPPQHFDFDVAAIIAQMQANGLRQLYVTVEPGIRRRINLNRRGQITTALDTRFKRGFMAGGGLTKSFPDTAQGRAEAAAWLRDLDAQYPLSPSQEKRRTSRESAHAVETEATPAQGPITTEYADIKARMQEKGLRHLEITIEPGIRRRFYLYQNGHFTTALETRIYRKGINDTARSFPDTAEGYAAARAYLAEIRAAHPATENTAKRLAAQVREDVAPDAPAALPPAPVVELPAPDLMAVGELAPGVERVLTETGFKLKVSLPDPLNPGETVQQYMDDTEDDLELAILLVEDARAKASPPVAVLYTPENDPRKKDYGTIQTLTLRLIAQGRKPNAESPLIQPCNLDMWRQVLDKLKDEYGEHAARSKKKIMSPRMQKEQQEYARKEKALQDLYSVWEREDRKRTARIAA